MDLTYLQATVAAPPGLTAHTTRGEAFEPTEVQWCAYPWGLSVTLIQSARRPYRNVTLYPPRDDVSGLPHPGDWFDHMAEQVVVADPAAVLGLDDVDPDVLAELLPARDRGTR